MTTFVIIQWNPMITARAGRALFFPSAREGGQRHSHPIPVLYQPQLVKLMKNSRWLPQRLVVIWSEKAG